MDMAKRFLMALIICTGLSAASSTVTVAQTKSLSPPKAVSVPSTAYSYESKEGGFKVGFPARPEVTTIEKESSFGKTPITVCSLVTSMATYSVTFVDFPTVLTDKYDLNIRFDAMRDSQEKQLSGRVMSDSEYYFGTYYGRSNVLESATATYSIRTFVVGPRMFILIVHTKGKLSTQSEKLRTANENRINKFFHSFLITKMSEAKAVAIDLPSDFGVLVEQGIFSSKFFDFSFSSPDGWFTFNRENSDMILDLGKELTQGKNPKLVEYLTPQNARVLGVFSNGDAEKGVATSFLLIMAERAPYPNFLPSAVAKTYLKLYLDQPEKVTKNVSAIKFGGADFAWIETFDSKSNLYNRLFFANRRGISLEFLMIYKDESDLKAMLKSMNSLTFSGSNLQK